ncbi:MAG: BMP family ABC transporter substrate-binding protein [Lachnospiraceae bacterium]|nr:BMP family ABC transporter substrate-binding protein [Lachnospiraceae bacterium]
MKRMSKALAVLMAGAMALSAAPSFASAEEETYKVAMVTDYGDITDQSFNQTTYEACAAFCEENGIEFQYYKPTDDSTAARVESVDQAVAEGYNVIVMPGYAFAGTIVETAEMYPDVKFVALDVGAGDILEYAEPNYDYVPENWEVTDYYYSDNVYIAIYQEELAGYMAGVAAVKLGYRHIGFLGGMAVPAVIRYGCGFVQGISDAAAELGVSDEVTVEYVYGNQFYGDSDITAYMDTWYQTNGVEVVFACGGGIYTSAAEAAAKVDGKVIGVDVDQAGIIDGAYGEGMTVTSAMKGLAATVNTLLTEIIINDNWDAYVGQIQNLGLVSETPSENYVQLGESTQWSDDFTEDDYAALVASMYNGEITVNNDTTLELDEAGLEAMGVTVTVNAYGNIK